MKVSIVMAVCNGEAYLQETIDSILSQTYPNLEIIIVNDGSTDATPTILQRIKGDWVKIIHLEANQGAANALNIGINLAEGAWIAIHDADDLSLPHRIEAQVSYVLANPEVVAVGSLVECFGENLSQAELVKIKKREKYLNSLVTREQVEAELAKGVVITHSTLFMSKEAFLKAGEYNSNFKIAYDYDLFLRLIALGPLENVPQMLCRYRVRSNSLCHANMDKTQQEFLIIASRYIGENFFAKKKNRPRVVVCGTKLGCHVFQNLMNRQQHLKVQGNVVGYDRKEIKKACDLLKRGNIEAIIVLTDALFYLKIKRYLQYRNLKVNKDFFILMV